MNNKIYITYGLVIFITTLAILLFLISLYFSPTIYYGLGIFFIPIIFALLISLSYLYAGWKNIINKITDLSIKVGFVPTIILILGLIILGVSEEVFENTLFPENPFVYIILPLILGIIIFISYIIFIIGLIKKDKA